MKTTFWSIVLLVIVFSCTSNKAKVLRYHKRIVNTRTIDDQKKVNDSLFTVSGFVLEPNPNASKGIFDLSAEGQSALIEAMSKNTKTVSELSSAIASPISENNAKQEIKSFATWKKRIVINITKIDKDRANRLQYILLTISIPDSLRKKVEFISWDKIVTETQGIDLGKITAGTKTALSFSPEITMAGGIVGTSAGSASVEKTFGEEKSFTSRYSGLNASLVDPYQFKILRQATANEDISGNIVSEITIRSTQPVIVGTYTISGLFNGNGPVTKQADVKMTKILSAYPDLGRLSELPVNIEYNYRYRKVEGESGNTEPEDDDEVYYLDGTVKEINKFKLFSINDMQKYKTWQVLSSKNNTYLHINLNGKLELLRFSSASEATQLVNWIKLTKNLKVADGELYLGIDKALTTLDISDLTAAVEK